MIAKIILAVVLGIIGGIILSSGNNDDFENS